MDIHRVINSSGARRLQGRNARAAVALAAIVACSDPGITYPPANGTASVGSEGGVVRFADSSVSLVIPAGALTARTRIEMRYAAVPESEGVVADSAVALLPDGLQFAKPVTLRLRVDATWLPDEWSTSALSIARWSTSGWQAVPTELDAPAGELVASLTHFGIWSAIYQQPDGSSPDYEMTVNGGCYQPLAPRYSQALDSLSQLLFGSAPTPEVGCVTNPYLATGYSRWISGLQSHAGIDFRARTAGTPIHSPFDGKVVFRQLSLPNTSTLTIESRVGASTLRMMYLHCASHLHYRSGQLLGVLSGEMHTEVRAGDQVCQSGAVGAGSPHLHIEVKRSGQDLDNLMAMSGSRGICATSSFSGGWDAASQSYSRTVTAPGCSVADIRAHSIDPASLFLPPVFHNFDAGLDVVVGWLDGPRRIGSFSLPAPTRLAAGAKLGMFARATGEPCGMNDFALVSLHRSSAYGAERVHDLQWGPFSGGGIDYGPVEVPLSLDGGAQERLLEAGTYHLFAESACPSRGVELVTDAAGANFYGYLTSGSSAFTLPVPVFATADLYDSQASGGVISIRQDASFGATLLGAFHLEEPTTLLRSSVLSLRLKHVGSQCGGTNDFLYVTLHRTAVFNEVPFYRALWGPFASGGQSFHDVEVPIGPSGFYGASTILMWPGDYYIWVHSQCDLGPGGRVDFEANADGLAVRGRLTAR